MLVSDDLLLYYQRCDRRAFLDVFGDSRQRDPLDQFLLKLRQDSRSHRREVLSQYHYQRPDWSGEDWYEGTQATLELMEQGVESIYRGVLAASWLPGVELVSKPDLFVRHPGSSRFGDWFYVPYDIRFGKRPKLDYQIVGAFHGLVLSQLQEVWPPTAWLVLRGRNPHGVDFLKRVPQMQQLLSDCIVSLRQPQTPELFLSRQKCNLCHWYSFCHHAAQSQRHLSLIPGITPNRYSQLQGMGIDSLAALVETPRSQLKMVFGAEAGNQLAQQAIASYRQQALLRDGAITHLFQSPHNRWLANPQGAIEIHFDIEAEPDLDLDFLLGSLVIDHRHNRQTYYGFMAKSPQEEALVWQQFLELMESYPQAFIFHFCDYEVKTIQRLAKLYNTPKHRYQALINRCVDIHWWVTHLTLLPVESYALKPIARWLGFNWRNPQANGAQCICWYNEWLSEQKQDCLEAILEYNEDDCRATYTLKTWLTQFLKPYYLEAINPERNRIINY
ncbi:TM0106 family RecB-like putative nuclease [Phormidium yuhuli AB48]|uniref:TM0106 family RecB-like putative nuclease n=1 Tax=Phormidium yuhuli AB48 TaxID=2940671 RepID=A0ABY5AKR9_9CYAN|nr:TM0106 family RecB-like putative nuclease [Phormidium yuhuli]USR89717.1 TM0106 family RecB-like putative nuclease [Phormidium yuhuli AB48]